MQEERPVFSGILSGTTHTAELYTDGVVVVVVVEEEEADCIEKYIWHV